MIDLHQDELIIDSFAGGGGASLGIFLATGRHPDVAINHDEEAVALHAANHPTTLHLCQSVWSLDPQEVRDRAARHRGLDPRGARVGLFHASPDCKHFSKAKGGQPREKHIRDLAWVVVAYAERVAPRIITLENVEEFQEWGPLVFDADGKGTPCPVKKGFDFKRWVRALKRCGYRVEWRTLRACDYGAPTIRKRLFLVARNDGQPIVWPAPSHAKPDTAGNVPGGLKPWRTAAEIVDWSLPTPSIFLSREEGRAIGCKRPLADKTMARIARGVKRYVLDAAKPFLVPVTHTGSVRVHDIDAPLRTVTTAQRGEIALVAPHITKFRANATGHALDEPLATVTANSHTSEGREGGAPPLGLVAAHIVRLAHGEHKRGPGTRTHAVDEPVRTIHASGGNMALVAGFLAKYYGEGGQDQPADAPAHTIPTKARLAAVTVTIDGETYAVADIGMRMLIPRELYRAQGFPDSYIIDVLPDGTKLSKAAQIRMCGNSVCPDVLAALLGANLARTAKAEAA
jgi:DNA (cytosine-5)-methyltransferase 1